MLSNPATLPARGIPTSFSTLFTTPSRTERNPSLLPQFGRNTFGGGERKNSSFAR